ncbi:MULTISPECIES: ABC-three component system middle component 6 [unclassified Methylobacterium]|jgi:hypothetical protein|uniref:ABC-three component system middle component 6 n=1 Tax=unclassified Methylobacterium TaxID=2615210 RepID=UPI0005BA85C7|nr:MULTISPECIES: ABC-three component system middle component 6 [unclassified Methylobacterium]SFU96776.1 hypothetical protein SAMN02799643_03528 [Methylobacterium sp. UNCCL125]
MILPGKHLSPHRAIAGVGAEILAQLDRPRDVTELWERVRMARAKLQASSPITFDWFVLALTFLYAIQAIEDANGLMQITNPR